jgi:hypothetical protein
VSDRDDGRFVDSSTIPTNVKVSAFHTRNAVIFFAVFTLLFVVLDTVFDSIVSSIDTSTDPFRKLISLVYCDDARHGRDLVHSRVGLAYVHTSVAVDWLCSSAVTW